MEASNIDLIREIYAAHQRGDVAAAFAMLHPDIEIVQTPLLPWGGVHRGLAGAQAFFATILEHTQAAPQIEQFVPAGEDVAAVGRLRGTARKTGRAIDLAIVHIWTVRDGRVVRFAGYIDTPAMLAALG